jgi:class 3 adenylate cyclase/tetratricopeptide (TPR) repeat protein
MSCGTALVAPPRNCTRCGADLPESAMFCIECGTPADERGKDAAYQPPSPDAYTPHHLARKILRSKHAVEGERKQVTVLFADVSESMRLAERVDPEVWHSIVDDFFSILSAAVHRYEGTVNQYTGDGIMALFGAPIAHEDHAQRACYAALHMLDALREYANEIRRRHGLSFSVRIGINSGEVVVGKIGDDLRMEYTAQGHTVGLASRMEALAAPNSVYLTGSSAALVGGYFKLSDLGDFQIKGVSGGTRVYQLEGVGEARTRLDVSRARGFSRFVGRDREMELLEEALAAVRNGERRVVAIFAEAGSGKSRLCYEFLERCRARGVPVYEGHCVAHGKMLPYVPVVELLRQFFEIRDDESERAAREKIAGRMLLCDENLKDALPLIFDFLGVPDAERPLPAMEPEARRNQIFSALGRMLQALPDDDPEIVLVEDLHWIDGASEHFLKGLVGLLGPDTRTLVLLNSRPGYETGWLREAGAVEIALAPLDGSAVSEILRDLLGADPSVQAVADRVREETGGNPFFVEEVVRTLIETGKLVGEPGAYVLSNPYDEVVIPTSVHTVLAARIDRLTERDKDVLERAAVIGKRFAETLLVEVVERPPAEIEAALSVLTEAGFLEQTHVYPNAEYAFRHPLTQEVAYRTQLGERRKAVHHRVAEALEAACKCEKPEESSALLAHHWEGAGDRLKAVVWSRRAAEWAGQRDLEEARRHWEKVRELLEGCEDCPDAYDAAIAAREALIETGWKIGGNIDEARRYCEEGLAMAQARGDHATMARMQAGYAMAQLFAGRVEEGLSDLERAVTTAAEADDNDLNVQLISRLAYMKLLAGRPREALELYADIGALASAERSRTGSQPSAVAGSALDFGGVGRVLPLIYLGRYGEAHHILDAGLAQLDHRKSVREDRATACTMYGFGVTLAWFMGEAEQAIAHARRQLVLAEELGVPTLRATSSDSMAVALMMSRRFAEALEYSERALRTARESGTILQSESVFLANLCAAYTGIGRLDRALELGREAVATAHAKRTPLFELRARLILGRALAERDGVEALAVLAEALALAERTEAAGYAPFIHEALADAHARLGDEQACRDETELARRMFEANGAPAHAARLSATVPCEESSERTVTP